MNKSQELMTEALIKNYAHLELEKIMEKATIIDLNLVGIEQVEDKIEEICRPLLLTRFEALWTNNFLKKIEKDVVNKNCEIKHIIDEIFGIFQEKPGASSADQLFSVNLVFFLLSKSLQKAKNNASITALFLASINIILGFWYFSDILVFADFCYLMSLPIVGGGLALSKVFHVKYLLSTKEGTKFILDMALLQAIKN